MEKVGRKYIQVSFGGFQTYKYYKDSLEQVSDYAADFYLYLSKQEILDEQEISNLVSEIRSKFDRWGSVNLTLDQLRRISKIISE
ncbi:hypothetical protein IC621_02830 [Bacillus sp. IB182487]|uniref:Uncharacterized protein n=1 Tax=Metabacillus arenae TaxID=2771434 RepID=A0A926NE42_9BACI|nr:hypothetical protein [Metabacillus arenae]